MLVPIDNFPKISVAIPEYDPSETKNLSDCIYSVLEQDYDNFEVVVISESEEVSEFVVDEFGSVDKVSVEDIDNPDGGVSVARNAAVNATDGEVIAYIDSDAIAQDGWLKSIGEIYRDKNVLAVGGRAVAEWEHKRPKYLPDEFLWLVGVTHKGHAESGSVVRSTFGCNMSYRKSILTELRFNENLGKEHGYNLQGEEPELGLRMREKFNSGMYYTKDSTVSHRIDAEQSKFSWLSKRAYLQGVSKAIIEKETKGNSLSTDKGFLSYIVRTSIPTYLKNTISGLQFSSLMHLFGILYLTFLVGIGYIVGRMKTI